MCCAYLREEVDGSVSSRDGIGTVYDTKHKVYSTVDLAPIYGYHHPDAMIEFWNRALLTVLCRR